MSDLVIVSNRLPVQRAAGKWRTSPGGLVSALKPILSDRASVCIGWAGAVGQAPDPFVHDGIHNMPVRLTRDELASYYDGLANATIWPLYLDASRPPVYRRRWWGPYVEVNRRFAAAAAETVAPGGPLLGSRSIEPVISTEGASVVAPACSVPVSAALWAQPATRSATATTLTRVLH